MVHSRIFNKIRPLIRVWPIFLVSLIFILDSRYFTSPPLRSDDWNWIVYPYIFEPLKIVNLMDRRPLLSSLLAVLTPLFGLSIHWYYVVNWLLIFLSGLVFYLIVRTSFPEHEWLALPTTLIYLIYPVNYARTWLIIINNTYALLLALIAILLMVHYSKSGKLLLLTMGNGLFLISLGTYEAGFGIVLLAAVILIIFGSKLPNNRRILIASFLATGVGFLVWRTFIQPNLLNIQDFYIETVNTSLLSILRRYIQGLFIFLFNWVGPLLIGFGESKYWVFVGIASLLIFIFLILLPKIIKSAKSNTDFLFKERIKQTQSLFHIVLIGGLFWAAGYIPVILLWQPIFYGDGSRVNFSSVPGAALALTAGVAGLISFLIHRKHSLKRYLFILILPIVILGMIYQVHSQNIRFQIWETNKIFWQLMFEEIQGIASGTKVIIVIPGYDDLEPFEMLPFRGDWEAESALRVLYNNPTLFAEYYYLDIPEHPDNWVPLDQDLSQFVFVYYDIDRSLLRIIQYPEGALAVPVKLGGYQPFQRITSCDPKADDYRSLVD